MKIEEIMTIRWERRRIVDAKIAQGLYDALALQVSHAEKCGRHSEIYDTARAALAAADGEEK